MKNGFKESNSLIDNVFEIKKLLMASAKNELEI